MLVACSRQAPAQNPPGDSVPAQNAPADSSPAQGAPADNLPTEAQTGLREVPLIIHSKNGVHRFTVEVAASPQQQEIGLMFRRSLAGDRGMIFPYDPPQEVAFWMKNTLIPLDIVFVGMGGKIVRITNAEAMDLTPLPSGAPVTGVLEIRAGRAKELGIREGDKVSWTK